MQYGTTPEERTADEATTGADEPVTLMNTFQVPEGREDAFLRMWKESSEYFRRWPGFLSLRLHRSVTPGVNQFVNVARWASDAAYRAPHGTDEFRQLVGSEGWREFPSSPVLYDVVFAVGDDVAPVAARS